MTKFAKYVNLDLLYVLDYSGSYDMDNISKNDQKKNLQNSARNLFRGGLRTGPVFFTPSL